MKTFLAIAAILVYGATALPLAAGAEAPPDWWAARNAAGQALMKPDADIIRLVSEVQAAETGSGQATMYRLYLFMRAGLEKDAARTLEGLKTQCPDLGNHQVATIYYSACDELVELYQAMAGEMPDSSAPAKALAVIEGTGGD